MKTSMYNKAGLLLFALLLTGLKAPAAEEPPSMEFLMFLAEFTDEQGNWNAEEIEEADDQPSELKDEPQE